MPQHLSVSEWVNHIDQEYLSTFIKHGGATIKFVVPNEVAKPLLKQSIKTRAEYLGYQVIDVDSIDCRFHMPQDIFFALAKQVDWRLITRKFILRLAEQLDYQVHNIAPTTKENIFAEIATANNLTKRGVLLALRPKLHEIPVNKSMAKDFRVAMTQLCIQEESSNEQCYRGQPIIDWLTGSNTRITNVRQFLIHTPINRTTARVFLESALYWFHEAGLAGTLIMLDNSRVTVSKRPADGSRYYTRAMAMEHYELLRQFIDSAERLQSTAILTISNDEFLNMEPDSKARGIGIYQALQTRIMSDVYDRDLVNPNAPLIRIAG